MIGAGAKILGNIEVGRGAKIGAGSVVLQPVPPHTTAAGVPARIVGKPDSDKPSMDMDQHFNGIHHTFEYGDGIWTLEHSNKKARWVNAPGFWLVAV